MWKFLLFRGDCRFVALGPGLVRKFAVVPWSYIWARLVARL